MIIAAILLLSYVVSTQSLSCAAPMDGFTLTNMLHAAEVTAVVRIIRDITPKPKPIAPREVKVNIGNATHPVYEIRFIEPLPQIAGLPDPKYYTANFQNALGGDYGTGNIIVRGGIACGVGSLKVQTTYLLFGSIRNEKVEGTIAARCQTKRKKQHNQTTVRPTTHHVFYLAPTQYLY
jgi:hypothetical protein